MENPKSGRAWLMAVPPALLLALLVIPPVRQLMLSQLNILFNSPVGYTWVLRELGVTKGLPEGDPETEQAALRSASLRNALDYQTQLAYSLKADAKREPGKPDERVVRLNALAGQFAARPALYAHILRYATDFDVKVRRTNEIRVNMYGQKPIERVGGDPDVAPPDTATRLAEFDRYAVAGARLETDNAYFPMMRAIGLFAAHKDKEALDSLREAGRKSNWDDHINDEAEGDWKLLQQAFGENSATLRSALQSSVVNNSIPHFEALRDVGKMAVYSAVLAEKAGNAAEGYEIRRAISRCANLMRIHSRTLQGSRSGVDIVQDVIARPGGALISDDDVNLSVEQRNQTRYNAYFDYLKKIGHPEEAAWAQQEIEAGKRVTTIKDRSISASLSPYGHQVKHLNTLWMGDFTLLNNALEMLVLILAGVLLSRIKPPRPTQLESKNIQGSSLAIALLMIFVVFTIVSYQTQWGPAFGSLRATVAEFMSGNGEFGSESALSLGIDKLTGVDTIRTTLMTLALLLPVVLLIALAIKAQIRQENPVQVIISKMGPVSALFALLLVLAYAGSTLMIARDEAQLHASLDKVLVSEGRYDAELIGQTWPQ